MVGPVVRFHSHVSRPVDHSGTDQVGPGPASTLRPTFAPPRGSARTRHAVRMRGEISTGVVARPWAGWLLAAVGVAALTGSLGPWAETAAVTVNGGVLNGRWGALSSVGMIGLGIVVMVGLGYRWVCLLALCASSITVAYGVTGFDAGKDLLPAPTPAAWGVYLCVAAGIAGAVASSVAAVVRAPYRRAFDRPLRTFSRVRSSSSPRSEPMVGLVLLVTGVLGMVGSIGTWTDDLIPPDKTGLDGDGVLTLPATAAVAVAGLLIADGLGRLWVSVLALGCATASLAVSFIDYARLRHLTHGLVIHGGALYSIAWGLYLLLASSALAFAFAIRAVAHRGMIVVG